MAENSGVLVICEVNEGALNSLSTELLGCGKKLSESMGQQVSALLLGSEVGSYAGEVTAWELIRYT